MMRGWVGPAPVAATPYNIPCANGHRLRGDRTEGYQALRCPSCGEAVFVLPRSPLPEPPVPTAPKRARSADNVIAAYPGDDAPHALVDPPSWASTQTEAPPGLAGISPPPADDIAEIDWVDEVAAPAPAGAPTPAETPRPATGRPAPAARPRPARPAAMPVAVAPVLAYRMSWRDWVVARRNPLLAVALVLVVLGAVSMKRWRQHLEELPRIAELGRTEGFKKLDSGDFFAAKKILADAAAAVDALGGRVEGAEAIRQAAREAALFTDLVPSTLEDLVEEATTYDVQNWSAHFSAMYRGRSILLETTMTAAPDPAKPGSHYEDAYRIFVGRGSAPLVIGRLDYTGFELFELAQPKVGETKIIGARLAALEFNLAENVWLLTLEPASGAFITHAAALEALHWPTSTAVEEPQP